MDILEYIIEPVLQLIRKGLQKYRVHKFDSYRDSYDSLSFTDKKDYAWRWLAMYPEQAHYTYEPVAYCFNEIIKEKLRVIEVGGWRGDLATRALKEFDKIDYWHNYDILNGANYQKCTDQRYKFFQLNDYIWNLSPDYDYNILLATHVIEHIKWNEFLRLAEWINPGIKTVLFEAPLPEDAECISWKGDNSSHVLEKGWGQVISVMKEHGFNVIWKLDKTVIFQT